MTVDNSGSADMNKSPDLPHHLIFGKILSKIPTKVAIQSSFLSQQCSNEEDLVSSSSVLDFDEEDDFERHNYPHQHDRFVKFLEGYLEYYRNKGGHHLDTLRLNMKMNTNEDVSILNRWLKLGFEKGVKSLDISCLPSDKIYSWFCCRLCWLTTFANAKFLTSLKLDCVRFHIIWNEGPHVPHVPIFPALKTLSFKGLQLSKKDLFIVLRSCPSLEHLSFTDFCFKKSILRLPTFSLKSLKFMFCEGYTKPVTIEQEQADIFESFTWIGVLSDKPSQCLSWKTLCNAASQSLTCLNLQCVNIVEIEIQMRLNQMDAPLFPSLKTMSFKNIGKVDDENFVSILLSNCPSLEHLSFTKCCFKEVIMKPHVSSSSLKSLEIKQCSQLRLVQIDDAKNLESFTFVWLPQQNPKPKVIHQQQKRSCKKVKKRKGFRKVVLHNSFKLNNINICVNGFVEFSLNGCQPVRSHLDLTDSFHKIAPYARINIDPIQYI